MFRRFLLLCLNFLLIISPLWIAGSSPVYALQNCNITVTPIAVLPNSTNNFTFELGNPTNDTINWVRITRPSTDFTLGTVISNWDATADSDTVTFTGSSIPSVTTETFTISVTSGPNEAPAANWLVEAAIGSDGSDNVECSGGTGTEITNTLPEEALVISNISVSGVTTTSVKINWTTNISATSEVDYGESDEYGLNSTSSLETTSHSRTLNSLTAETTYHFKVRSITTSGQSVESEDNTFTTAALSTTTTTTVTNTTTTTVTVTVTVTPTPTSSTSLTPEPGAPADRVPPTVVLNGDFTKAFTTAPTITGSAGDNVGLRSIEYSIDDGRNWLPVTDVQNIGNTLLDFSFLPDGLNQDGNYQLRARATDTSGLTAISTLYTVIIDRLPPKVGANLVSIGPQALMPESDGVLIGLAGLDEKVTVSAIGGPTTIDLLAGGKIFSLAKNIDNGLWSGAISFQKPGVYQLSVKSIDGAKNQTSRRLNSIVVLENGKVKTGSKVVSGALVSVYYFDEASGSYALWDGNAYSQPNPQKTNKQGQYRFLLPAGKFYITVSASGYKTLKSEIFTLDKSTPINSNFEIEKATGFGLGKVRFDFPSFNNKEAVVKLNQPQFSNDVKTVSILKNKVLPSTSLVNGERSLTTSYLGKPTILTLLNTWSPAAASQLQILEQTRLNNDVNVLVVVPNESVSQVTIFQKRGNYDLDVIADPDGELIDITSLNSVPTHLFINRKGIVQNIQVGVQTENQLTENLVN